MNRKITLSNYERLKNIMNKNENCACPCKCGVLGAILLTLIIIGGINWGLIGIGMLLGVGVEWNLVKLLLGSMPMVEALVYVLVGLSAILKIGFSAKKHSKCNMCCSAKAEGMSPTQEGPVNNQ